MIVYLNGEFVDARQASLSPFDRGFLFGDGVYEVTAVYQGCLYEWQAHAKRLFLSLQRIHLSIDLSASQLYDIGVQLLKQNELEHATFYLQISRGAVIGRRDHFFTPGLAPTVFAYVNAWPEAMLTERTSVCVQTIEDQRWQRGEIKSVNLLANTQARQTIHAQGLDEGLFVRDGLVVEGTSSNLFLVKDGVLVTPPERQYMLTGITRQVLLRLAQEHQLPTSEREITTNELAEADEIWITSTVRELRLVRELNGKAMPSHAPVYEQMRDWFNADKLRAINEMKLANEANLSDDRT